MKRTVAIWAAYVVKIVVCLTIMSAPAFMGWCTIRAVEGFRQARVIEDLRESWTMEDPTYVTGRYDSGTGTNSGNGATFYIWTTTNSVVDLRTINQLYHEW